MIRLPWNLPRGMEPSDYVDELVEMEQCLYGVPPEKSRADFLKKYTDEQIRQLWWHEIGSRDQ